MFCPVLFFYCMILLLPQLTFVPHLLIFVREKCTSHLQYVMKSMSTPNHQSFTKRFTKADSNGIIITLVNYFSLWKYGYIFSSEQNKETEIQFRTSQMFWIFIKFKTYRTFWNIQKLCEILISETYFASLPTRHVWWSWIFLKQKQTYYPITIWISRRTDIG